MENLNIIKPKNVQGIINKFCFTIGMIPSSYKLSLTYEEQIIAIGKYLEETVYPSINNNAEALAELQGLFAELKNYVENYFDNLDVQTEINNKLNSMIDDGTFNEIINQELFNNINQNIEDLNDELDNLIQNNNQNFENLNNKVDSLIQNKLVVFGDSWSDLSVTDAIWSNNVANTLNLELLNYAVNGATFVSNQNKLISSQIQTFRESSVIKSEVKYIVILGGINDYKNDITTNLLQSAISSCVTQLQTLCPNAKILYVSNCEYPYTFAQSEYWSDVHNFLTGTVQISTLNLDGIIGNNLYNNANYYHLTQAGQKWMAKQIVASLTGGKVEVYRDLRRFENSDAILYYFTHRQDDMIIYSVQIRTKTSKTAYDFSFSDDVAIPYSVLQFGSVVRGLANMTVGTASNALAIRFSQAMDANADCYCSTSVNIYGLPNR